MKSITRTFRYAILFVVFIGLHSCVAENCVVCSMEGVADVEMCSDGSILDNSALEEFRTQREAEGFTCN